MAESSLCSPKYHQERGLTHLIKARDLLSVIISNFSYITFSFVSFLSSLHSKVDESANLSADFLYTVLELLPYNNHELNLTTLFRFILEQYQWLQWLFWLQNHAWANEKETRFQTCFDRTCHILGYIVHSIYKLMLRKRATVMKLKKSYEKYRIYLFLI